MSSVIYWMQVSLDGFVARPDGALDWANVDDELHTFANEQARAMGTFLYGRRMYEIMASYWPTAHLDPSTPAVELEFAHIWNDKPKIVFSKTLDRVAGQARLLREVVPDEIAALKAQPGNDMGLGGANIATAFMRLGLIDEYLLLVHPVVLGRGIPCFPPLETTNRLRLVETQTFRSGVVYLRYQRVDEG
ncbi:MAG TPA: dihydrofolate reductase family protein [Herpetosiphonaceae bacterium]|nr:dihydrofolate reductase family protein [Herpetosiphonaceae bacterium]